MSLSYADPGLEYFAIFRRNNARHSMRLLKAKHRLKIISTPIHQPFLRNVANAAKSVSEGQQAIVAE